MDLIKSCAQRVNLGEGVAKFLEFASKPQEWATGMEQATCHIICEVLAYQFLVNGEQANNNARTLVHLTLYNSAQSCKDLAESTTPCLRKVVHEWTMQAGVHILGLGSHLIVGTHRNEL